MKHIDLPVWAITEKAFEQWMISSGLASMIKDEKGNDVIQYHRDLRGVDEPGAMILPDKDSGVKLDEDGNPSGYNSDLPGFYYNLRAVYRKPRNGIRSLAEILYTQIDEEGNDVVDEDGNPVLFDQYETVKDEDGNDVQQLKNIAYRCRIPQIVLGSGGTVVDQKGFTGDPKAPKHLDVIVDGVIIFRVFDPDDINTPHNMVA